MTLIGPGTWEAALGAAGAALTAADLVAAGEPAAYACCRPPGHHATRSAFGGSCYLNNAAAAAARLRESGRGPVAVIDIDAHHGNGTQSIFYAEPDVLTGSVHVDPGAGWFPHYLGFAGETGAGEGEGANRNLPLAPGCGDGPWLEAVADLAAWAATAEPAAWSWRWASTPPPATPRARSRSRAGGYREAGRILGAPRPADRHRPGGRLRPGDDRPAGRRDPARPRAGPRLAPEPNCTFRVQWTRFVAFGGRRLIQAHTQVSTPANSPRVSCRGPDVRLCWGELPPGSA